MNESKDFQLHQIAVERKNLAQVCRFAVKGLIDRSCFDTIGENSPEIVNFCNIMEHVLTHRLKPRSSWYSQDDRSFWNYVKTACLSVPHNCIASIRSIEHITTPRGKGRAWLKVVLMEKRLSEYISTALKQTRLTKAAYTEDALMLSDDVHLLTGALLGLNAMDFSFDLKGENVDIGGLPVIDYSPFLKFQQCAESIHSDRKELHELSNSNSSSSILSEDMMAMDEDSLRTKYLKMETKYKGVCEQKGYLEELVRLRQDQLEDVQAQRTKLVQTFNNMETENKRDRQQLESVIIELQAQLAIAKQDQLKLAWQLKEYLRHHHHQEPPPIIREPSMEAINYHEVQKSPLRTRAQGEADRLSTASNELSTAHGLADNRSLLSDSRSLLSELSAAGVLLDDTSSMIPMAGSFTSLSSARSGETRSNDTSKFKIDFVRSDPMTSAVNTKLLSPVAMAVLESNAFDHDDDDNVTYYTGHNENKVCVTADVHRADSLLSPVEDKADLPSIPVAGVTVPSDADDSDIVTNDGEGGTRKGGSVEAHNGISDNEMPTENCDASASQIETVSSQMSSVLEGTDISLDFENPGHSVTNNVKGESGQSESGVVNGAVLNSSPNQNGLGSKKLSNVETIDKNMAEEILADQERLDDFRQPCEGVMSESLTGVEQTGDVSGKSAEEDHNGDVDVGGHNGEENYDIDVEDDDYHWDE
ncbi:RUN domain-containing protein 3B-like [Lineus longissimus]|uniref:RUN domain-containing protein 3B-like n=1 Tax=Lineus longissimus TaxID=88925 RepID=UPI00315DA52A